VGASRSAIGPLMEQGEVFLRDDVVEGPHGETTLVVTSHAFYLTLGGRLARCRYEDIRSATFDARDVYLALNGRMIRLICRRGTDKNPAIQILKQQIIRRRAGVA
jgi:hypothetical protein